MVGGETGQSLVQPFLGEVARRGDRQLVRRLARLHRPNRFLELQKAGTQRVQPGRGLIGQFQPFGCPPEHHNAQHILKRADLLSDSRWRYRQFIGSFGKAEVPGGGIEHTKPVQW